MWWVAYYVVFSMWLGGLSSGGSVGFITVGFGGFDLCLGWGCGYNVVVRLRDKESPRWGLPDSPLGGGQDMFENTIIDIMQVLLANYDDSDLAFIEEQNLTFGDMGLGFDQELSDSRHTLEVSTKIEWAVASPITQTFLTYSLILWDNGEGDCLARVTLDSVSDAELLERLFERSEVSPEVQLREAREIMLEAKAFDDAASE